MFTQILKQFGVGTAVFTAVMAAASFAKADGIVVYVPGVGSGTVQLTTHLRLADLAPKSINLDILGLDADDVRVLEGDQNTVSLSYNLYARDASDFGRFGIIASRNEATDEVVVRSRHSSYQCSQVTLNGVVTVRNGLCVRNATLVLPRGAATFVTVNRKPVRGALVSVPSLILAMKHATFSSDKEEILDAFVKNMNRGPNVRLITMAQVIQLMEIVGTFDAKEIAQAFSGRVLDPQNAALALDHIFEFDKKDALLNLSR